MLLPYYLIVSAVNVMIAILFRSFGYFYSHEILRQP